MPESTPQTTPPPLSPSTVVVAIQSSPWYKSKTLWAAAIGEIINLLSAPMLVDVVGAAHATQIVGSITLVLMALLRLITFSPITGTPGATAAVEGHSAALAASVEAVTPTIVELASSLRR